MSHGVVEREILFMGGWREKSYLFLFIEVTRKTSLSTPPRTPSLLLSLTHTLSTKIHIRPTTDHPRQMPQS